jgi:hypothetical protein
MYTLETKRTDQDSTFYQSSQPAFATSATLREPCYVLYSCSSGQFTFFLIPRTHHINSHNKH